MPAMDSNLRVPGPTPIPVAVREAQARPMINHRGPEFAELLEASSRGIARLIGTDGEVFLLTGSGTGAMEAAVVNTVSPGDRVLVISIGSFGDRFGTIAAAFGASVDVLEFEWGLPADPDRLATHLAENSPYRAVFVTHNETSTGVSNPVRELAATIRVAPGHPLVVVDGISGLGAMPFHMDEWGVDLVISASQKAFMASPGISIAALGPRGTAASETATSPRYYWDFREARKWAAKGQTPWTPAVSVLYGLQIGVAALEAEGASATWARHAAIAAGAQAGLEGLGLALVAPPGHRSATVSAAWLPEGLAWPDLARWLREHGLVLAGGQGKWAGRILRMGHMGDVAFDEIAAALETLGHGLEAFGHPCHPEEAVAAGWEAYRMAAAAEPVRT